MNLTPESALGPILVVDDDSGIASMLEDLFSEEGYRVIIARNGKEALSAVGRERPSLVLTDWMMPQMDGPHFVKQWRLRDPEAAAIPVIVMSSAHRPVETLTGVRFLLKTFALEVVLGLVASLLTRPGAQPLGVDVLAIYPFGPH
jgi:DNA-binding response OmpR family regulator